MIKIIETGNDIVDLLLQQKITYQIVQYHDIANLTNNDILLWDIRGFVDYHDADHLGNFLETGGKIILINNENYKIFHRIESRLENDIWYKFIKLTEHLNKKDQILVLIEGKIHQFNSDIKCTPIQYGWFEWHRAFIPEYYDYYFDKNIKSSKCNYGTAAIIKPTRISREKFYNKISQTEIDLSQINMLTKSPFLKNERKYNFMPDSLKNSYCSIIHETDVDPCVSLITEKTCKPIMLGRFWITLTDYNYYDTMKFLGFDVFEDIFDLSFSREIDTDRRVDLFVDELVRVNYFDFEKLNNKLKERIDNNRYNLARAFSIDYHQRVETIVQLIEKHQ